jgi:signal transduction histidine kinase
MREPREGLIRGQRSPTWVTRNVDRLTWYASVVGLERWARLVAVALAPLLLADRGLVGQAPVLAALAGYVAVTALTRGRRRLLRIADVIVAVALILAAGTEVAAYLPFLLVTVAGLASHSGLLVGLGTSGALAAIAVVRLWVANGLGDSPLLGVLPLVLLLLLTGFTSAAAGQVMADRSVRDRLVLQQANRLLTSLRALADEIPGGLDVSTVAAATVAELRAVPGATGALVLVEEHGLLRTVATTGTGQQVPPPLPSEALPPLLCGGTRLRTPGSLPSELGPSAQWHRHWSVLPLGGPPTGVLLVGFDDLEAARRARPRLAAIAQDAGLALENAQLFDGTQARAAHSARRRVASDLHDGVAQSLTHLRMELELMARTGADTEELDRLSRVAGAALTDLRGTIQDLRKPTDGDLVSLLARHLDAVRTEHGPTITFERHRPVQLDAGRAQEVLRVAQEAVSNALRHAAAEHVVVRLGSEDGRLRLEVQDDGVGLDCYEIARQDGLGLRTMDERARRLGGELSVASRDGPGGGTRVALTLPAGTAVASGGS